MLIIIVINIIFNEIFIVLYSCFLLLIRNPSLNDFSIFLINFHYLLFIYLFFIIMYYFFKLIIHLTNYLYSLFRLTILYLYHQFSQFNYSRFHTAFIYVKRISLNHFKYVYAPPANAYELSHKMLPLNAFAVRAKTSMIVFTYPYTLMSS